MPMRTRLTEIGDPIRLATKLQAWLSTLPEFVRPVAEGALAIVMFMLARGAIFILPIAVLVVLLKSPTPLADLAQFAGFLVIAILAGALSGLAYTLIGRRLRRLGAPGYYLSAIVTAAPYMLVLIHLDTDRNSHSLLHSPEAWEYGFAAVVSVILGILFGHAFYKRDQRKALLAERAT
jgi:hypothetical protein